MIFLELFVIFLLAIQMKLKAMQDLINWKKNRKPLLLYEARQVGKTYLVKAFVKKYFEDVIYINFETNNVVNKILEEDINPSIIIKNLEIIFDDSIDWSVNAGITNKCIKTNIGIPLKMYEENDSFKLYMNDVGLLTNLSEFPLYLLKNREAANELMIGMLTENYVASSLKYNGINLYYWKNDYDSKLDFILQSNNGNIIPLEVKSSTNV